MVLDRTSLWPLVSRGCEELARWIGPHKPLVGGQEWNAALLCKRHVQPVEYPDASSELKGPLHQ